MTGLDDTFAKTLREMRESKGLTQTAFARLVVRESKGEWRFTQQTIARVESGTRRVTVGEAAMIAALLGASVPLMLGLSEGYWADVDPRDRIEGAIRELEERARQAG